MENKKEQLIKKTTIRLTPSDHKYLIKIAKLDQRSLSGLVGIAIKYYGIHALGNKK